MASISSHANIFFRKEPLISPTWTRFHNHFTSIARDPHCSSINLIPVQKNFLKIAHASDFSPPLSEKFLMQGSLSSRTKSLSLVAFSSKTSGTGDDDLRALETVLKFYTAIKDRNIYALSNLIGDECRCVCNFITYLKTFHGKKQVLEFFALLMTLMKGAGNIEFVVQPTLHDGMNVEVRWKLGLYIPPIPFIISLTWLTLFSFVGVVECIISSSHGFSTAPHKIHLSLGKGISFHLCQVYDGKVLIRNIEMFMEPLLHIEPLRLKLMGFVMSAFDGICSWIEVKDKRKKAIYILLILSLGVFFIFMLKRNL